MLFRLRKGLPPEISREEMRNHYERERAHAVEKKNEPITAAMLSSLAHRYHLRKIYISDVIHRAEISPFAMMVEWEGRERLIDYLLFREGLSSNIDDARQAINRAFRDRIGVNALDSYQIILALLPFMKTANIWWFDWLDDDVLSQISADATRREEAIAALQNQQAAPFTIIAISHSSSLTASIGEAALACQSAVEAVQECARLHRRGVREFIISDDTRKTITMRELLRLSSIPEESEANACWADALHLIQLDLIPALRPRPFRRP